MEGLLFSDPFKNGAYLKGVGGSFSWELSLCTAFNYLFYLYLLSLFHYLVLMFSTCNITGKSIKQTKSKSHDNSPPKCMVQVSIKIHV